MAANSSNTAGWLTPVGSEPTYDAALDEQIKQWIQGITAIPEERVINNSGDSSSPFSPDESGCIYLVSKITAEGMPVNAEQQDDDAQLWRDEMITCVISFFGPQGQLLASRLRDGNCLSQNEDELHRLQLSVSDCDDIIRSTIIVNNVQVRRHDVTIFLKRKIIRHYGIQSLVEAPVYFSGE